jgi:hypothetical protein
LCVIDDQGERTTIGQVGGANRSREAARAERSSSVAPSPTIWATNPPRLRRPSRRPAHERTCGRAAGARRQRRSRFSSIPRPDSAHTGGNGSSRPSSSAVFLRQRHRRPPPPPRRGSAPTLARARQFRFSLEQAAVPVIATSPSSGKTSGSNLTPAPRRRLHQPPWVPRPRPPPPRPVRFIPTCNRRLNR